jgi:hypothetical protein
MSAAGLLAFANGYQAGQMALAMLLLLAGVVLVIVGVAGRRRQRASVSGASTFASGGMQWAPSEAVDFFATTSPGGSTGSAAPWSQNVAATWSPPPSAASRPSQASGPSMAPVMLIALGCVLSVFGVIRTVPIALDFIDHRSVVVPAAAGTLALIEPPANTKAAMDAMKAGVGGDSGISNLEAGVYARKPGGQPSVVLIVGEVVGNPGGDSFWRGLAAGVAGSGGTARLMPAATSGQPGEMRCGTVSSQQIALQTCIWVDGDTLGVVMALPGEAAPIIKTTKQLRNAAVS